MAGHDDGSVVIRSARTGRPPTRTRTYKPSEPVRVDTCIPASLAQRLYDNAHETRRPLRAVITDLLSKALDDVDEARMG